MARIEDTNLDLPVEFTPYQKNGSFSTYIKNVDSYFMKPEDTKKFISELNEKGFLELIEESLQSLAQRSDGTQLLTAMPSLSEVKAVFSELQNIPIELLSLLTEWEALGCNELDISFVKKLKEALAPMTDDDDFHQEGCRAFLAGLSEDENPYTGLAAEHWSDGWEDAQEDAFPSNRNGRND